MQAAVFEHHDLQDPPQVPQAADTELTELRSEEGPTSPSDRKAALLGKYKETAGNAPSVVQPFKKYRHNYLLVRELLQLQSSGLIMMSASGALCKLPE